MDNKTVARTLRTLSQLMELYDENPFKIRSIANSAFKVDKLPYPIAKKNLAEIEQIDGVGKNTASKIWELIQTTHIAELSNLIEKTPAGILEIMSVKGLGPKKVKTIWTGLGIENLGELYYACNENRLIEAKGFGLKTQEEIKKAIEFKMASNGRFLYVQAEAFAEDLFSLVKNRIRAIAMSFTGGYRRRCEIIDSLDLLIATTDTDVKKNISHLPVLTVTSTGEQSIEAENENSLKINIRFCEPDDYAWQLVLQTGNEQHIKELQQRTGTADLKTASETDVYTTAGLPFIEPELREGLHEFNLADTGKLPELIEFSDLNGVLHNHSTWSDGVNSIEEMALYCRDTLNLQYLGISDHSKSAVYANGLNEIRVIAQIAEVDALNKKLAPFRIFKGIESDILHDGSLDYPDEILALFDFVVASVHSVFKMTEEKATERLIRAIENPFTTILGHPTGRLLLSRSGYPVNFKKIIDACAANQVVIEINSNPLRLDMDWRWHQYAIEKGVMLSINPDAHRMERFYDMHYGTLVARKGGVSAKNCLNCLDVAAISNLFSIKRSLSSV